MHHLLLILPLEHRRYRAEDLVVCEPHVEMRVCEGRRLDEESVFDFRRSLNFRNIAVDDQRALDSGGGDWLIYRSCASLESTAVSGDCGWVCWHIGLEFAFNSLAVPVKGVSSILSCTNTPKVEPRTDRPGRSSFPSQRVVDLSSQHGVAFASGRTTGRQGAVEIITFGV